MTLSAKTRELLESETSRLTAFVDFLRERGIPVLDFWAWDRQFNAQRWQDVVPPARLEAPLR